MDRSGGSHSALTSWRKSSMSDAIKVGFVPFSAAPSGILVVFCDDGLKLGPSTRKTLGKAAELVKRAAEANQFKGKNGAALDILAPEGIKIQRLIVIGTGKASEDRKSTRLNSSHMSISYAVFCLKKKKKKKRIK